MRRFFSLGFVVSSVTLCVALGLSSQTLSAQALRAGSWQWPVEGPKTISRNYAAPLTPYSTGHRGIDIVARQGDPVFAPDSGTVHFAGTVVDRGVLSLDHGRFLSSFEPVTPTVVEGQRVSRGEVIAYVASSGHCTCLHMGARENGLYLSPLALLSSIEAAVLLPWRD